ncbi:hypothetical protein [Salipiger abyssi]|uniref:hypothetical protein n=1 Tax=Salipiger abyssi TaxID=1250539 RepID=UPI001A8FD094|nr:hypothetical protein [Salipiger abyssi]MBN9890569.1 hypothetical protein [Salipiger abyssi]
MDNEIVDFVIQTVKEHPPKNLYLELPQEIEEEFYNSPRNERFHLLQKWSSRPEKTLELYETAEANDVNIRFFDSRANLEAVKAAYESYTREISSQTEESASELLSLRMEVNQKAADYISNTSGKETAFVFSGMLHTAGNNDIDNMVGLRSTVINIYHRPSDRKSTEDLLSGILESVETDGQECVFIESPSASIPVLGRTTFQQSRQ